MWSSKESLRPPSCRQRLRVTRCTGLARRTLRRGRSHGSARNGIDRYYVLCTRDRAIPPSLQRRMVAENPCAGVIELDTDHTPQRSMTNELAKALHEFATHSSAGAGRLADRKDRAHFRRRQL